MVTKKFLKKTSRMLDNIPIVILASINEEGYPRPVTVAKLKNNGLSEIWISTGTNSAKIKQLRANPKAGLTFYDDHNSISLTGDAEVVADQSVKRLLWQDWLIDHFPEGMDDPDYTIIKFVPKAVAGWIDDEYANGNL